MLKSVPVDFDGLPPPQLHIVRGQNVMLDSDVARFFELSTKVLNQQVKRNAQKFGGDFAFRLTAPEAADLRSQKVTSSDDHGGSRYLPNVFTEHGVVMAATVLRSDRAVAASRFIVKTFVQARQNLVANGRGQNLKATMNPAATIPLAAEMRQQLFGKINEALGAVLNAIVNPETKSTVRSEAIELANEGLSSLKAYLKRPGVQNDKTVAEIRKLMAEAENIEVATSRRRVENEGRQLALLALKLRLVLEAQHYAETGRTERFLGFLKDFSNAGIPLERFDKPDS
jgi:hypothetical protein